MGEIFDHKLDHRNTKIQELISTLEMGGHDPIPALEEFRSEYPEIDEYLKDIASTSAQKESIAGPSAQAH